MHELFSARRAAFPFPLCLVPLCWAAETLGQAPAALPPAQPQPTATAAPAPGEVAPGELAEGVDPGTSSAAAEHAFSPGFEGGLRLGIGLPVGSAGRGLLGESRKVSDLAQWRTPVWVDIGYQLSPVASYGLYAQIGFGGSGDACADFCDWSDLRMGAQGRWRLSPGADVDPWLGLGVGYEALSVKSFEPQEDTDGRLFAASTTELLGGPELLLQGGLELRVEDSLQLGPFLAASIGSYLSDSYKCSSESECPGGSSIDGSGFHAWIGVGLSGRYSP